ncbi:MAG TPA: antitoxin Xre/MbcA/ParS toxin-binding domain-containing protein [Chitinophagaceae bacterium]
MSKKVTGSGKSKAKPVAASKKAVGKVAGQSRDSYPLNEAAFTYGNAAVKREPKLRVVEKPSLATVLFMEPNHPEFKMTSFEKIEIIEEGISKKALENLKEKASLDYDQLSQVLNVARATLINKKGNDKFSKDVSDKILGLASIYSYGYEVFEDRDRFNSWVFRPNQALGGQAPFDLLHNTFGREEVKNLIGRIDYGVYS